MASRGHDTEPAPRAAFGRWCAAAAVVAVLLAVAMLGRLGGAATVRTLSDVAECAVALAAAVSCAVRAAGATGRHRTFWALLGGAALSWAAGQTCWTWYEVVRGDAAPFPSMADVGFLGMPVLTVAALLTVPGAVRSAAARVRTVLDGLIIASSLLLVSWVLVLTPMIRVGAGSALALWLSLAYPVGDVIVVTMVAHLAGRYRGHLAVPVPLHLIGAGLVTFAMADTGFTYLTLSGRYSSGGPTDLGWIVGFLLIALAARKPAAGPVEPAPEPAADTTPSYGILLPYVAVVAAVVTSTVSALVHGGSGHVVLFSRTAIILLMVGRQVLTLRENRSLTRDLEARVAYRTAELRASEQRFEALVQHSSDVVTVVDPDSTVRYQSEAVQRIFGYPATKLIGRRLADLLDADSAGRLLAALHEVARRPYGTQVVELAMRRRGGRYSQAEVTVTNLLDDPSVGGLVLNSRDVSERRKLENQLVHEASHDSLTRLANRALFTDRVVRALRRRPAGAVAVLFLDLDGFKEVNDSLGHACGDQLLVQVAERLIGSVRGSDTVARFGGDEFAVLAESVTADEAVDLARRLVDGLRQPFELDGRQLHVRASIGVAATGPDAADADQLMRNADLAMYRAKATGAGGYVEYDPQMHRRLVEKLQLETDLRDAIASGAMQLHYQPTIDLESGAVTGFEALARWRHPERGLVPPLEFIPLAESTGLIRPLGEWVLREACRQAVAWGAAEPGRRLTMNVNVSGRQFEYGDLADVVARALADAGLPAGNLCLEMTESVLMNDTEENLALVRRLKGLGVKLAIDDFGTGYSSLSYLHRFPVDTLKIDRSFVERLGGHGSDAALARTIVQLGQSLGMATVAEGIEEHHQLLALQQMTCDLGQGFYFSRPLPAAEAGRLLDQPVGAAPRTD